jgi:hypothetical protein
MIDVYVLTEQPIDTLCSCCRAISSEPINEIARQSQRLTSAPALWIGYMWTQLIQAFSWTFVGVAVDEAIKKNG